MKQEIKENLYPVFKKQNAMKLRDMGFEIRDAESNCKNPRFVVYLFQKTDEFLKAFDKLNEKQSIDKK